LQDDELDLQTLALVVQRDASLTYRLLRLANSPVSGVRQEVRSVQGALLTVGEATFRKLATLAIASELNQGQPPELLRMAFVRARFCELAAHFSGLDRTEQYLLGLLSLVPAMLRLPMGDLIHSLPVRNEIRLSLLGERLPERSLLCWLESHERGDWMACDRISRVCGLDHADLQHSYEEAVGWAEALL
jgi:EAL and modified HD-GYP domain-containing signal transduction protein